MAGQGDLIMRLGRVLCFLIILGSSAIAANAQTPVDPEVIFKKDPPADAPITQVDFTIVPLGNPAPPAGCNLIEGGSTFGTSGCSFINVIDINSEGEAIGQLTLDVSISSGVTCMTVALADFSSCHVSSSPSGSVITFSGGSIPFEDVFGLGFVGFPAGTSFEGSASVTPELNSSILMLTGAVFLFVGWTLRRTAKRQPLAT
jgi:hypothetical protein